MLNMGSASYPPVQKRTSAQQQPAVLFCWSTCLTNDRPVGNT